MTDIADFLSPDFEKGIIVIVGGYGSGKSEVAVNLARYLAAKLTEPVAIADLDIVNPYFRSREAAQGLARLGIKSLIPPGQLIYAEIPIIIPEIKSSIERSDGKVILDVGGDEVGAKVLSSIHDAFREDDYEMLLTLNANRPFTADLAGTTKIMSEIEVSSELKFTGIISNTHMLEQTEPNDVLRGLELARQVSNHRGIPVCFVSALTEVLEKMTRQQINCPVLPLHRSLLKPWERDSSANAI